MSKKCKKEECPAGEKWAVPFADFLSLLLALFIALYALASVNVEKQRALKEEFLKIYGFHSESQTMSKPEPESSEKSVSDAAKAMDLLEPGKNIEIDKASKQIERIQTEYALEGNLDQAREGVFMSLPAHLLFDDGTANVSSLGKAFLAKLSKAISYMPDSTSINVKGFAQSSEVAGGSGYEDGYDLSSARSNNVIRELVKLKIPKHRLYATSFVDAYKKYDKNEANPNQKVEFELDNIEIIPNDITPPKKSVLDGNTENPNNPQQTK